MKTLRLFALAVVVMARAASAQTPEWIWFNKSAEAETRYFRKAVAIDGTVTKAELIATADDELVVFVNGEQVLAADSWQNGHKADVKAQLKTGANVIGIRAKNSDASAAGAIAQLTVTTDKGKQVVVTDASWKAAERSAQGWNRPGFDESEWVAAKSLGKVGMAPWGQVFAATVAGAAKPAPKPEGKRVATPAEQLFAMKDFKVELLLNGEPEEGSWVNLCKDAKGRFILSPQYRASNPDGGLHRA